MDNYIIMNGPTRQHLRRDEVLLRTNNGGVAVVAANGIGLAQIRVGTSPSTFECESRLNSPHVSSWRSIDQDHWLRMPRSTQNYCLRF